MSFVRHSEPKRTSTAKGTKERPLLSRLTVACVTRTRRSRGGGLERAKRLPSELARGLTSPASTRCCTQVTSDGSSAKARDGTEDSTNAHQNSEWRHFT